jgi:hypothetical protein
MASTYALPLHGSSTHSHHGHSHSHSPSLGGSFVADRKMGYKLDGANDSSLRRNHESLGVSSVRHSHSSTDLHTHHEHHHETEMAENKPLRRNPSGTTLSGGQDLAPMTPNSTKLSPAGTPMAMAYTENKQQQYFPGHARGTSQDLTMKLPKNISRFTKYLLSNTRQWPLLHGILLEKDSRRIFYFAWYVVIFHIAAIASLWWLLYPNLNLLKGRKTLCFCNWQLPF